MEKSPNKGDCKGAPEIWKPNKHKELKAVPWRNRENVRLVIQKLAVQTLTQEIFHFNSLQLRHVTIVSQTTFTRGGSQIFWSLFKNLHCHGRCTLRPCISMPYCSFKVSKSYFMTPQKNDLLIFLSKYKVHIKVSRSENQLSFTNIKKVYFYFANENMKKPLSIE